MRPKIFKAETIQRAIADVKDELGPDAMILSTRRIPKNPRDPYAKGKFAVEAAPKGFSRVHMTGQADKNSTDRADDAFGFIKDALVSIKDIISIAGLGNGVQTMMLNHPGASSLFALLLRTGISEKMVSSIMQKACFSMENHQNKRNDKTGELDSVASLKNYVIKECIRQINTRKLFVQSGVSDTLGPADDLSSGRRLCSSELPYMAAFVGPTGAGKTTTIAKLAAELTFKRKKRVGLISIDNYRVGAFEQLKAYASIMGLGCIPAFNSDDFSMAVDKMRSMDIILIDTAGHSHSDKLRMDELAGVVNGKFNVSVHLVLSMTTGVIDMKAAASSFASLNPETYVFTKIDETNRRGKIMDQINELSMPVSLVTNGQRVPEDLIIPDKRTLLSIMLGTEQTG